MLTDKRRDEIERLVVASGAIGITAPEIAAKLREHVRVVNNHLNDLSSLGYILQHERKRYCGTDGLCHPVYVGK